MWGATRGDHERDSGKRTRNTMENAGPPPKSRARDPTRPSPLFPCFPFSQPDGGVTKTIDVVGTGFEKPEKGDEVSGE